MHSSAADRSAAVGGGGGSFEHPSSQGLDQLPVGALQEAPAGRVPLELFTRGDAEAGGYANQVGGEGGQVLLREDHRGYGEQAPEAGTRGTGLLAVVQERHPHPGLLGLPQLTRAPHHGRGGGTTMCWSERTGLPR